LPKQGYTLDCGCGPAYYRDLFSHSYVGVDIQRKFPRDNQFVRASAFNLPFRGETFDLVLVSALLEHVRNPNYAVFEIWRVLKSGGCAVLSAPSRFGVRYETLKAFRGFDVEDLELMVRNQGFKIFQRITVGGVFSILFAEIESFVRTRIKVEKLEVLSFEGEQFYRVLSHSVSGRLALRIRESILHLLLLLERKLPAKPLYQGACIFVTKDRR
jgi:SAM-dependent methyltransferase